METPDVTEDTFRRVKVEEVKLVVPDEAYKLYVAHDVWKQFFMEVPAGIEQIDNAKLAVDNSEIYDLNGTKRNNLQRGINIVRANDGTTKKVLRR